LNVRREVAAVVRDPANVATLLRFFEIHGSGADRSPISEWSIPDQPAEDDDSLDELD